MPPLVSIHPFQYGEAEVTSIEEDISLPDADSVVEEAFGCPVSESNDDIIYEIPCPKCGDMFNGRECNSCGHEIEECS